MYALAAEVFVDVDLQVQAAVECANALYHWTDKFRGMYHNSSNRM